ncbi:hypothetical protein HIM_06135 [Hirsutella minnesotensis 3608]|uniref:Enterotoxin n=1 Tax=Hirsutella minnesotensis 3608 TaxID=1043627 RepID=A0A0F8A515_9HYPO|nr:hypothetical protein HIM_06135 [Hirsutella minnesotensis 3608]
MAPTNGRRRSRAASLTPQRLSSRNRYYTPFIGGVLFSIISIIFGVSLLVDGGTSVVLVPFAPLVHYVAYQQGNTPFEGFTADLLPSGVEIPRGQNSKRCPQEEPPAQPPDNWKPLSGRSDTSVEGKIDVAVWPDLADQRGRTTLEARDEPTPSAVYRVDSRSPDEIRKAGGFLPRGSLDADEGYSVYKHVRAARGSPVALASVYVSTSGDLKAAEQVFKAMGIKEAWIYRIDPTPNIFSVKDTLKTDFYPTQKEWIALGGTRWDQTNGYAKVKQSMKTEDILGLNFQQPKGYVAGKYSNSAVSGPQPALAGFDDEYFRANREMEKYFPKDKTPKEAGQELLRTFQDKGYEPPQSPTNKPPVPPDGKAAPDGKAGPDGKAAPEVAAEANSVSKRKFTELVEEYKLKPVFERWGKTPDQVRIDTLRYEPLRPDSPILRQIGDSKTGLDFRKLGGNVAKGFALDIVMSVPEIVDAFSTDKTDAQRTAALTSWIPIVGCTTQAIAKVDSGGAIEFDNALCVLGDALMVSGSLAPLGILVHLIRFIASVFSPPPALPKLDEVKKQRDEAWKQVLRENIYTKLYDNGDTGFGNKLKTRLASDAATILSNGADVLGVFEATSAVANKNANAAEEREEIKRGAEKATDAVRDTMQANVTRLHRNYLISLPASLHANQVVSLKSFADGFSGMFNKQLTSDDTVKKYAPDGAPGEGARFWIETQQKTKKALQDIAGELSRTPFGIMPEPLDIAYVVGQSKLLRDGIINAKTLSPQAYLIEQWPGRSKSQLNMACAKHAIRVSLFLQGKHDDPRVRAKPTNKVLDELEIITAMTFGREYDKWKEGRVRDRLEELEKRPYRGSASPHLRNKFRLEQEAMKKDIDNFIRLPSVPPLDGSSSGEPVGLRRIGLILGLTNTMVEAASVWGVGGQVNGRVYNKMGKLVEIVSKSSPGRKGIRFRPGK